MSNFFNIIDHPRTRTWNLLIRSQVRYPITPDGLLQISFFQESNPHPLTLKSERSTIELYAPKLDIVFIAVKKSNWGQLGIEPRTSRKFERTQSENYTTKLLPLHITSII